jgi:diguanylate cyclase (GGDEF)-like protein
VARFRSLSSRLTTQFALLFAFAMVAVSIALSTIIASAADKRVEEQMQASGAVYDRLWQQRVQELQNAALLLSRDFGFRSAVASGDEPTLTSALGNAAGRLQIRTAFIVTADGQIYGIDGSVAPAEADKLWEPLDGGKLSGVTVLGGRPVELAAAPIMAPTLIGWVVFISDLDSAEMRSLERLSAIPLDAALIIEAKDQTVQAHAEKRPFAESVIAAADRAKDGGGAFDLQIGNQPSLALVKPLAAFADDEHASLLLTYPKSKALADANRLLLALAAMTLIGLLVVAWATWRAAARITRPLASLDAAAGQLAAGEQPEVEVQGSDELARLAESFNRMAGEIVEREQRITQLAFNDALTGLPNRTMFQQQLTQLLQRAVEGGSTFSLLCLDLDNFKAINDTIGHPAGDALLIEAAKRIRTAAKGHFVARLGGDEFVVLQPLDSDRTPVDRLASRILEEVARPLVIDGNEILPSTSIGIAIAPDDGVAGNILLKNADLALYRAKESGRNGYAFFEEDLNARAQHRHQIETELRSALERGEFELLYQPLFDLRANQVTSFESLIRWNHPQLGSVPPAEFVPIAEESGLIVPIGAWAIERACKVASKWPADIRVAVNVSPVQFHRGDLRKALADALGRSKLAPERLELEITESVFLEGSEPTLALLHALRKLGVRIALDDFGTGFSSLSYLQSFPFDKLKIDQSFIVNLLTRDGAGAIVRAITDLAQALGIETTAEGVEEEEQLDQLRSYGCSSVQGYLFAEPMNEKQVRELLKDRGKTRLRVA